MTINLTTTAAQDVILERLRVKTNLERAALSPPLSALADIPALVTNILTDAVLSYRSQQLGEDAAAVSAVYIAGSNATRTAIRTAAGLP